MGHSEPRRLEERLVREVVLALCLILVAIIQVALLPRPLGIAPNLLLLLAICQSLIAGPARAARWAFYGGLALDVCAGSLLGTHALALLIAVMLASLPLVRFSRENWLLPLCGALLGAIGYYTTLVVLTALFDGRISPLNYIVVAVLPDTLLTLIPALPVFMAWRAWLSRSRGEVPVDLY